MEFVVSHSETGLRLDLLLVRRVPEVSRAGVRRLIERGMVRVNGRIRSKGNPVREGDRITLEQRPAKNMVSAIADRNLKLQVCFEDAYLVVVEKPAGIASHPLRPGELGSAAAALLARYPEMAEVGYHPREPGLVHRLDNDTSGLLLAARNQTTFEKLRIALKTHQIDKRYIALCRGELTAPLRIEAKLAVSRRGRRVVKVVADAHPKGRYAVTEILESEAKAGFSLVQIRVFSAVRHQIRAHLAARGHPLAGDTLYRGPRVAGLGRQFLHASELRFNHPETGGLIHVSSPLPPELSRVLFDLGGRPSKTIQ
ncbi:MAG: RluA family pseudouridine synthase [Deltaproteobacteria bacterium]|nr:RluA family pseudouridine synthase [Deltaproteobacteria bacterium]